MARARAGLELVGENSRWSVVGTSGFVVVCASRYANCPVAGIPLIVCLLGQFHLPDRR